MKNGTDTDTAKCDSMPLGAHRAYYGKVRTFLSVA